MTLLTISVTTEPKVTAPAIKMANGTKIPDTQPVSIPENFNKAPIPAESNKKSVSFSTTDGWHMEFLHPETGEVVERFPAKQVTNVYQNATRNRG